MYSRFGLVLTVNHACNLRCSYCYTGEKFSRPMPQAVAERSIDRGIASLAPAGTLELSFFGGEPLLESPLILHCINYAMRNCEAAGAELALSLTTNGTIDTPAAWSVMLDPAVDLTISFDGTPAAHDRHRRTIHDEGTSNTVVRTIRNLVSRGRTFQVLMVVRPDTISEFSAGLEFLRSIGADLVVPSLDLWTQWTSEDLQRLESALTQAADVWRRGLPEFSVSWFNEKLVLLTGVPTNATARCGFGVGEVAVAPSGNLYPCERLIGEDRQDNGARLKGHALTGADFLNLVGVAQCGESCAMSCPCSNLVRTGNASCPDELLRTLDRVCEREARRVIQAAA